MKRQNASCVLERLTAMTWYATVHGYLPPLFVSILGLVGQDVWINGEQLKRSLVSETLTPAGHDLLAHAIIIFIFTVRVLSDQGVTGETDLCPIRAGSE